jgi:hypothetical protein
MHYDLISLTEVSFLSNGVQSGRVDIVIGAILCIAATTFTLWLLSSRVNL